MKRTHRRALVLFSLIAVLATALVLYNRHSEFEFEGEGEEEEEERGRESGSAQQMEYLFQTKAYPNREYLDDKFLAAWEHAEAMRSPAAYNPAARTTYGAWSQVGTNLNVGRVLSIAVDPTNNNNVFIGSASGGIWKSTNATGSWSYVPVGYPVLGVPAIAFQPGSGSVILAGTGEVYRNALSNIGYNVWKARGTYGIGILRSTDGGNTWTRTLIRSYPDLFGIQRIKFHPTISTTVFACTSHGIFRSTDAGATWSATAMLAGQYVSDLVINPGTPNTMVAAVGNLIDPNKGIYRTTNGGTNWTHVTGTGFPGTFNGFTRLAQHTSTANTIYASVGMGVTTPDGHRNYTDNEVYYSTDGGSSWAVRNNSNHCNYQFWFSHAIACNPSNPDQVIIAGINARKYTISTQSTSGGTFSTAVIHADIHDVIFDPVNTSRCYIVSDGGVYRSDNINAGTPTWSENINGLQIAQFYAAFGVSSLTANRFVGGLQDNGVWAYNGTNWTKMFGGDGGPSAISATTNNVVYASNDARSVSKSTTGITGTYNGVLGSWAFTGDDRTAFMAPIAVSRQNDDIAYVASDNLHRTSNEGGVWTNSALSSTNYIEARFKTGIAIAMGNQSNNRVYVSLSPFSQRTDNALNTVGNPSVRRTNNGNVAAPTWTTISTGLPNRFLLDFSVSSTYDDSVFVAMGGYGGSHIYLTTNGGTTWIDRSAGLPDVPFNAVIQDPNNRRFIYAGCDLGVYVSNDYGVTWFDYNGGFTDAVQVFDLQITADNRLVAATHGKGAWITNLATNVALPVNILSFTGENKGLYNELKWRVDQEHNVSHYELERRLDNGSYVNVARINARNTTGISTYTHDDNIRNASGTNFYYRLKIVDIDASVKYSAVVLIKAQRPGSMEIMGNPVTPNSSVRLTLPTPQRVVFKLFDIKGSLVHTSTVDASPGANIYPFSKFGYLAAGHYTMLAITNTERFSKRIIVK